MGVTWYKQLQWSGKKVQEGQTAFLGSQQQLQLRTDNHISRQQHQQHARWLVPSARCYRAGVCVGSEPCNPNPHTTSLLYTANVPLIL